tara:strand:+ start:1424 stop:2185 length:762 start_codon:yes stop_codon:yes gene_type:complete
MLVVVSPAKKLNMQSMPSVASSRPLFSKNVDELVSNMQKFSVDELKNTMGLSDKLAKLNFDRFAAFGSQEKKSAVFAFDGDTYQGLDATSLDDSDLEFAQTRLRILSGLYGLLRPLDAIEPYRLEMGSKLEVGQASSLYKYWGSSLAKKLNEQAKETKSSALINCASQEYFNAVDLNALELKVVTPMFLERKDGKVKMVSFFAKKARGMLARFAIKNRLTEPGQLTDFDYGGYIFSSEDSDNSKLVFTRPYPS